MSTAIKIENVSKLYRLGTVGTGTISHDLNRWWHTVRGKEDPYAKIAKVNDRTKGRESDKNESSEIDSKSPVAINTDYVWALQDINLNVEQGEILGIIGRNGAGKSTLLKLLSRVTAPTTGTIKTKGRLASLLEVGTGFHPELTGRENIYMNGAILGMRRHEIANQLDEIVQFSGCAKYIDTPVKRYSSGMMVRLGFAVAAHLRCELLIIDEVLAVGDSEFQKKCLGKIRSLSSSGDRTVLFVSHNMSSVTSLCTKAILLKNGGCSELLPTALASELYSIDASRQLHENQQLSTFIDYLKIHPLDSPELDGQIVAGKPVVFAVGLKDAVTHHSHSPFRFTIAINNGVGIRVARIDSEHQKRRLDLRGAKLIRITTDSLPLTPGNYNVKLAVQNELAAESIDHFCPISVTDSDFYQTGYSPDQYDGFVMAKEVWDVQYDT